MSSDRRLAQPRTRATSHLGPAHQLQLGIKRAVDLVACSVLLILGWPLLVMIGVLAKFSSPGPMFFLQPRVGKNTRVFRLIKFRSMTGSPAPDATAWTSSEEARITPVGRFLRDFGLDELPQVINIIKGDMSIIGPRPPLPTQVAAYTAEQLKAFQMRPGVLSLAAVEGRRSIPMEKRIALHVKYIENWSLRLDLWIFWRSLFVVFGRQHATETASGDGKDGKA
jgi:lipopolysaccharide/colanic/teichoic acid biosynthesis glycosyltransferase